MAKSGCQCRVPQLRAYKGRNCQRCARLLDDEYLSNDENLSEFFGLLGEIPGVDKRLLEVAANREREGRTEYGLRYLGRNNISEAVEEVADLIIYCYLHWLKAKRDGVILEMAPLIEAAMYGAYAYNALKRCTQWDDPENR